MTGQELLLMGAVAVLIALALIVPIVVADKKAKKSGGEEKGTPPIAKDADITVHACVTDMLCGVESVGYDNYRAPKVEKDFVIVFRDDDGRELRYPVDEEMYDGFEIGLAGMLSVVKGKLNSFVPDGGEGAECEGEEE